MSAGTPRFLDEIGKLMTDAAGVASTARKEVDGFVRSQVERLLRDADVVTREEFESVREIAILAREENEELKARIAALEAKAG
jgi:BMFP domain-containing protein YqiC